MKLEVGLGPGQIVLPSFLSPKGHSPTPNFGPFLFWLNGWVHQMPLGTEVSLSFSYDRINFSESLRPLYFNECF